MNIENPQFAEVVAGSTSRIELWTRGDLSLNKLFARNRNGKIRQKVGRALAKMGLGK